MTENDNIKIWGAISALHNLTEALWLTLTIDEPDPNSAIASVKKKMLAEWDLPKRQTPNTEGHYLAGQAGLSYLENFWDRLEERLQDMQQ